MSQHTLFDDIVAGKMKSWPIWEDEKHLAFLTPFPNTLGVTVVLPKKNIGDDVVELTDQQYEALLKAVKKVAKLLKEALKVHRVAIVFEGTGIAHVHAKLYPLHGKLAGETNVWVVEPSKFYDEYEGYINTKEGPLMDDTQLDALQAKIRKAAQ